jgi:hypothetical protein
MKILSYVYAAGRILVMLLGACIAYIILKLGK